MIIVADRTPFNPLTLALSIPTSTASSSSGNKSGAGSGPGMGKRTNNRSTLTSIVGKFVEDGIVRLALRRDEPTEEDAGEL